MKSIQDNDTIQIELTNACLNRCANCTRFASYVKPYFMEFDTFQKAIDSLVDFPNMTGFQGGEPLLHPEFEKFCEYALKKIPRERLGLWTTLPNGYEKYREIICNTFGNIFINDHSRGDIFHHPFLVASRDVLKDQNEIYYRADTCSFQRDWSASINPKGAYFCEMAASFSMLYSTMSKGWKVEKGWWKRTPKDYTAQIEEFCQYCGGCLHLPRRPSIDNSTYDISQSNYKRFEDFNIKCGTHIRHDLVVEVKEEEQEPLAAYKDQAYRDWIAARYGIFLSTNEKCFNEPYLMHDVKDKGNILSKFKQRYMIG